MKIDVEEGQRQMILLALAELALKRPGWDWTIGETAEKFGGREMLSEFKRTSADRFIGIVAKLRKVAAQYGARQQMLEALAKEFETETERLPLWPTARKREGT